jgi:hypothetical protein
MVVRKKQSLERKRQEKLSLRYRLDSDKLFNINFN